MNKVVYVDAHFKPVGKIRKIKILTGEKTKGFLGFKKEVMRKEERWEQTGWSDCEIDGLRLAEDTEHAIQQLNADGYEVVTVTFANSGKYHYDRDYGNTNNGAYGFGYGYGFSYTEGAMIVAKHSGNKEE